MNFKMQQKQLKKDCFSNKKFLARLSMTYDDIMAGKTIESACRENNINSIKFLELFDESKAWEYQKKEISKSWQKRLLQDVLQTNQDVYVSPSFEEVYELMAHEFLKPPEMAVFNSYYKENKTVKEIAAEKNVTTAYIHELRRKGIYHLNNPECLNVLRNGMEYYNLKKDYLETISKLNEEIQQKNICLAKLKSAENKDDSLKDNYTIPDIPISELNLTTRIRHILLLHNIKTAKELSNLTKAEIYKMRGLGPANLCILNAAYHDKIGIYLFDNQE